MSRLEENKPFYQMDEREKLNATKEFSGVIIERHVEEGEYHPDQLNAMAWLLEQAERVQELEKDRDALEVKIDKLYSNESRYKQALITIAVGDNHTADFEDIAAEALKGESNEE